MIKGVCGLAYDCKNADALADFMVHCLVGKKKFQVADGRHCVFRRDGYLFSGFHISMFKALSDIMVLLLMLTSPNEHNTKWV